MVVESKKMMPSLKEINRFLYLSIPVLPKVKYDLEQIGYHIYTENLDLSHLNEILAKKSPKEVFEGLKKDPVYSYIANNYYFKQAIANFKVDSKYSNTPDLDHLVLVFITADALNKYELGVANKLFLPKSEVKKKLKIVAEYQKLLENCIV